MGFKELFAVLLVVGCTNAQISRVCVPSSDSVRCQNMNRDGSQVACELTDTRVECASKLSRNAADVGMFSEEELLLLAQMPSNTDLRVVASIRDANRQEEVAFESVVVVASNHAGGFEGLRGGRYCHPGFGVADVRWSPRVLRAFEVAAARTDRCEGDTGRRTSEELEVEALNNFFSAACRPGPWSANATLDIMLKSSFPNLCSLCTAPGTCAGYSTSMTINIGNVQNSNRHIQALECLRTNGTVAYVAWQHVREYFMIRNPDAMTSFSLLCENGTLAALTPESLSSPSSPCALVRQPWRAIVTTTARAESLAGNLRTWWPQAADPGGNTWESSLFGVLAGGSNARVFFEETPVTPLDYTSRFRTISSIDSTASCLPARRWCTLSAAEQNKCNWIRTAAYSLGLQPAISCQQRANEFDCLRDIQESRVDFFSLDSHYGYLARRRYRLSPVKMVQNIRGSTSRLAALVKESSIGNITRFGNLMDGVACFPEYGSLAYVAFLRTAHQRGVISATECNYARAVGEFFSSACAPGATSSSHSIVDNSDFTPDVLCTACRVAGAPIDASSSNFTCAYNWTNAFYGNNGSLNCLAAPHTDVAFVEVQNIRAQMAALNLNHSNFRMLCQNDSLAINAGLDDISEDCLLTDVVDAEVLTRRNDAIWNSLNTFLDALDDQFGYNAPAAEQLINFHLYSSFDGNNDLLFKDSTIGLTEPTTEAPHGPARNYIDLFTHLESCTSSAPPPLQPGIGQPGHATRNLVSVVTMTLMGLLARFVVY